MDGIIADLKSICDLADKYDALVMVDDSHAVGFMGKTRPRDARISRRDGPRRHPHRHARQGAGRRQRRLHEQPVRDRRDAPPAVAALSLLELGRAADPGRLAQGASRSARRSTELRDRLEENTRFFRAAMTERKFNIVPGEHPIVPIMIGDAALAGKMAERLLEKGVYAIGFFLPGRAAGQGPRPRAGLGGPHPRGPRIRLERSRGCATSWDCRVAARHGRLSRPSCRNGRKRDRLPAP